MTTRTVAKVGSDVFGSLYHDDASSFPGSLASREAPQLRDKRGGYFDTSEAGPHDDRRVANLHGNCETCGQGFEMPVESGGLCICVDRSGKFDARNGRTPEPAAGRKDEAIESKSLKDRRSCDSEATSTMINLLDGSLDSLDSGRGQNIVKRDTHSTEVVLI